MGRPKGGGGKGFRHRPRTGKKGGGRRPKGCGKGRGSGKGKRGSARSSFPRTAPTAYGQGGSSSRPPPPLPADAVSPFLHPSPRPLVQVPLDFQSLYHWCSIIGNNILAEFWHVFREGRPTFSGFGVAAGEELLVENAPNEGLAQCLLLLDGQPRLVASQRILSPGKVALKLRGGPAKTGGFRSLGYVGSFLAEFGAILELKGLSPQAITPPMQAILEPKVDLPGSYAKRPLNISAVPVNPSQRSTIEGLAYALEKVQGPPGTGKSTTIYHILDARIPFGSRVLVTCSRNVAVESIAQKLAGLDDWPLCVFGPRDRVGGTARRYLLTDQVGRHFDATGIAVVAKMAAQRSSELSAAIARREGALRGCRRELFLQGFLKRRHRLVYCLRDFCDRVVSYCTTIGASPTWCQSRMQDGRVKVLSSARVLLCTIASTSRMLREWEESTGEELRVHTVIVDECGCTPESSTAMLLRLRPSNLILVGDHKQLPPVSQVLPQVLEGSGHTRSLLERCVLASGRVHQLREQYRMHPAIAGLVSNLFYAGRLRTPPEVAQARQAREKQAMLWLDVQGREEAPERSYLNTAEVSASVRICASLREKAPEATIALLTFYRGQLTALMHAVPSNLDVEVLTVDACQGSEFDFVVLSMVRCNAQQRLGFLKDQQRINVAISRARYKMVFVGSRSTLSMDSDWKQVQAACSPVSSQELAPKQALPSTFTSVFEALQEQKRVEADKRAALAQEESAQSKQQGRSRSGVLAEALMREQPSMSQRRRGIGMSGYEQRTVQRRTDGTYQSKSIAVAIGGGFRRRADVREMEAIAAQHMANLESGKDFANEGRAYHAPKSAMELEEHFPVVGAGGVEPPAPKQRLPRAANLRPSTGNDQKRQWRAQRRQAGREAAEVDTAAAASSPTGAGDELLPTLETAPAEDAPEADVDEAFLFSMFPDDRDLVEQTLLRFVGATHQASRAFEVLISSTINQEKIADAGEDDLDYDCAFSGSEDSDADESTAMQEDGEDGDEDLWQCAACGEYAETTEAEDGLSYCAWCWAEWMAEATWEDDSSPQAAAPSKSISGALGKAKSSAAGTLEEVPAKGLVKPPQEQPLGKAAQKPSLPTRAPKDRESREIFASLDGVTQWAPQPARPEAGGKELVQLKSKQERGLDDQVSKEKKVTQPSIPSAAKLAVAEVSPADYPARCKELLSEVRPKVDEAVIEYLASMMESDVSDDTKEAFIEYLEGYDVEHDVAGAVWDSVLAGV